MYISNNVAERIKIAAKSKGLSVKKILEEVGLGFNTMSNMKTSMPKADNLARIADYLGCSVDYLLGRSDEKSTPVALEYDEGTRRLIDAIVAMSHEDKKALARLLGVDYE